MDPSNAADQWVATGTGILEAPANEAEEIQEIQEIQVFRKEDVHQEYFFDPWAYVAINGKTYGKAVNCSLIFDTLTAPTTRLILDCREKFFKSEIAIEGIIERDMSPKYNPEGSRYYHFSVNITGRDIFNWTVQPPNSYTLPAYFNPLSDWVSDEKCLVSFDVGPVRIFNSAVPKLLDSKAEADLKEFFHDIREAKLQNKPFHFEIITLYFAEEGETYDSVMKLMEDKINNDKAVDPTLYWIKNSPNAHMLRQENIFAPRERPALSVENLVRKLRRTQPSHLDLKVHAVYCEVDEWLYERGLAAEIAAVKFMVTFEEVPGSAFMINRNDNKLPKMYISSIRWDNKKMERPRLGDSFVMVMPFKVPDPPKCLDGPKKQRPPPPRDDRDEDDVVDHGDYITVRESRAEYFERSEQARMDDLEVKRTLWHARLLESSELNAPGQPLMKVFRPKEPKWEGLHDAPTVGTVIPATETRIRSLARRRQYIAKDAPRHAVYIKKTLSDQTYKDTLRGLNELFEKYKEDLSQTVLRHHLVGYLTDGNVDAVFPPLDFFSTCVPDYKRFAANLTKYQRDRFFQAAQVQHGVMLVEGGGCFR
ncbi:hypothetical protein M430DRAFT_260139 [Amorphotheca resinae ATCC 22711]|jgi:hypothetical protein|uniref:Uncharacterized protein n=1 Tax=Amorphotheca resinae ATCC 22711 TaxID=857342 RepID=A0A2T3AZ83_AMORE|nr:hypothetical protein M430DRAFT_260139 [Amorphotheca resinae ATCC 22711]PSS15351.1 hypothetical protein M430DRAFT_260139 [Amorphotheca resinae ATCC 22711]